MDNSNREAGTIQESIDTTQIAVYRSAVEAFAAIVRQLSRGGGTRSAPPLTIDLKRGKEKFNQYSQGFESQTSSEQTMSAARAAHRNGESPEMVISLVRASPMGESIANSQSPAHANLSSAQIAGEAARRNVQVQHLKNNPGLAKSLQAKPIRVPSVSRSR